MAAFSLARLSTVALFLAVFRGTTYKFAANCVPGDVVAGLNQTGGRIGLYVMALKTLLPIYGNLQLMAKGPPDQCNSAANVVNTNLINTPAEIFSRFKNMTQLGAIQSMNLADKSGNTSYFYMFRSKAFRDFEVIADCVPGSIVGGLNQTGGRIALYTMALKTILPGIFGDLLFLGQGNNSACVDMMNAINEGNKSVVTISKAKRNSPMQEIGVLQGLNVADIDKSYIYVFKNKMWNSTWGVMLPNLQQYGLPPDYEMVRNTTL